MYEVTPTPTGGETVEGMNANTGSMWRTTTDNNGDMSGVNAKGQMWNYNSNSGTYMNAGSGKMCTGHGATRICTGGD